MAGSFHPHHVLLTGAAGAIGGALARTLAARHPQLRLSLIDCNAAGLLPLSRELGVRSRAVACDLADTTALPALWEEAYRDFGRIDCLINCAGFMEIRSFAATPWELGEKLLQVDLLSPLRLMSLAVQNMTPSPSERAPPQAPAGWIVNISSMAGRVPLRGCSFYGAAKSGLYMASQVAGLELAAAGVHVLTVLPGPVFSGLESRARSQVAPGLVTRYIPTGKPEILAQRIERALQRSQRRLVYPAVYRVADRFSGASGSFAATFGPEPTNAP